MSTLTKKGFLAKSPPFENTEVVFQFRAEFDTQSKWEIIALKAAFKKTNRYFLSDQYPLGSVVLGMGGNELDGWELAGDVVVEVGSPINIRTGETVTGGWTGFSPGAL